MMSAPKNKTVLRPYQRRWANDPTRLALAVKAADGMQMASRIARGRLREMSTVLN